MKKKQVNGNGIVTLLDKNVCLIGLNYIYYGKLTGVDASCVELENAGIVYVTGDWQLRKWNDFQILPSAKVFVQLEAIESFFEANKDV